MMGGVLTVVCVKWGAWCAPHGARYVNNLYRGIARNLNLDFQFVCFTDDSRGLDPRIKALPLPDNLTGWWWSELYASQRSQIVRRTLAVPYLYLSRQDHRQGLEEDKAASSQPIDLRGWYNKLYLFKPGVLSGRCVYVDLDTIVVGNLDELFDYAGELCILRDFFHQLHYGSGLMAFRAEAVAGIWQSFIKRGCPVMKEGDQQLIEEAFPEADFFQDRLPGQVVSYKLHCAKKGVPPYAKIVCFHGKPRPHEISDSWLCERFDGP